MAKNFRLIPSQSWVFLCSSSIALLAALLLWSTSAVASEHPLPGAGMFSRTDEHSGIARFSEYDEQEFKRSFVNGSDTRAETLHLKYEKTKTVLSPMRLARACKSSGGLLGAMDCVTKKIDEAGSTPSKSPSASSTEKQTGVTTTSKSNPDGTHTITKTDKDGNLLSKEKVGPQPASASSTDTSTGVTTTSVRNPDGSRTVTKTDKDGNLLSKEKVGPQPASASSTDTSTGITTTSVRNPDGSRTVTKTDKDGNVISREKAR